MVPRKPNIKKWEIFLNKKLTKKEKELLKNTEEEINMNNCILNLLEQNKDLYIPKLSVLDGDCFFDSLLYHIQDTTQYKSIEELRNFISKFMILYKNYKDIFTNQELTLKQIFDIQNEIEYLYDKTNDIIYKYTYDIMCSDIAKSNSWKRLPMELIINCISFIFDIKINIYHDNGYNHNICITNNPQKEIYLGLLEESHYIPLDIKGDNNTPLLYNEYIDKYEQWRDKQINN